MRRTMLCLTLLVGVIFTIGAAPSTASAANCTAWDDLTYHPGSGAGAVLYYRPGLSCSGVEGVRWYKSSGTPTVISGWFDYTAGSYANGILGNCVNNICSGNNTMLQEDHPGQSGGYTYGLGVSIYQYASVWYYGSCHVIAEQWWWQIKNVVSHQWGSIVNSLRSQRTVCV